MSRLIGLTLCQHTRFPRVSGDEPLIMAKNIKTVFRFPRVSGDEPVLRSARAASTAFSPRERG